MASSNPSSDTSSYTAALNQFYQWVMRWFFNEPSPSEVREKRTDLPSKTVAEQPSELKKTRQRIRSLKRLRSPVSASTKAATSSSFTLTETIRSRRIRRVSSRQSTVTEKSLSTRRSTDSNTPDRSSWAIPKATASKKDNNTSPVVPVLPRQRRTIRRREFSNHT